MRLTEYEKACIKKTVQKIFGEDAYIFVFGSRVDDTKKGGDIDLYITHSIIGNVYDKKIKLLVDLDSTLGEQKIDVVIASNTQRGIEQYALAQGVRL